MPQRVKVTSAIRMVNMVVAGSCAAWNTNNIATQSGSLVGDGLYTPLENIIWWLNNTIVRSRSCDNERRTLKLAQRTTNRRATAGPTDKRLQSRRWLALTKAPTKKLHVHRK